jgi:Fe-S cluster assembly iron-binding protein IscA
MLTLTDRAAEAVHALTRQTDLPPVTAGLRIVLHGAAPDSGQGELTLALTPGPVSGDEIVEQGEARVFVEAEAVQALDHQELDATRGADGGVKFLIAPQP